MSEGKTQPIARIVAKRKDAPKGEKGHTLGVVAIWQGEKGNYATLDGNVAYVQLTNGQKIVPGRDGEHWLNVYDNDRPSSRRTSRGDFPAETRESTWPDQGPHQEFDDDSIPF